MIDTFSANSLKILEKSIDDFENYVNKNELLKENKETITGNIFHRLIYYYLKNFEIKKFEDSMTNEEKELWFELKKSDIMNFIQKSDKIFTELPFFIKENTENNIFYLTGRFDCVVKNNTKYTIIDWKIKNIPNNPDKDIQTIVYLEAASKLFKTQNIDMIYFSIRNKNQITVQNNINSFDRIKKLVEELFLLYKNQNK